MSYSEVTPQYYQMHMPDSPWHAGSPGWKSQPWPSFGVNPNLVGPPRLAVNGLGAYYKPVYEKPIAGLGYGDIALTTSAINWPTVVVSSLIIAGITAAAVVVSLKK